MGGQGSASKLKICLYGVGALLPLLLTQFYLNQYVNAVWKESLRLAFTVELYALFTWIIFWLEFGYIKQRILIDPNWTNSPFKFLFHTVATLALVAFPFMKFSGT